MRKFWAKLHQFGLLLAQKGYRKEAKIVLKLGHYVPEESTGVPNFFRRNYDYGPEGDSFYYGNMNEKEPVAKWRQKHKGKGPNWPKKKKTAQTEEKRFKKPLDYGITLVLSSPSATNDDADYSIHFEKNGDIAWEDCGAEVYDTRDFDDFDAGFTYFIDWVLLEGGPRTQEDSDEVTAYSAENLLDKIAELPFVQQVLEWEVEEDEWQKLPEEKKQEWREDFKKDLQTKLREKAETPTPEELEKWFKESEDE